MSHFIATSITFSKDKKTFTIRGGDNNVVPRSNYTLDPISTNKLFFEVSFGSVQFTPWNIKWFHITNIANRLKKEYWWTWDEWTDMYHESVVLSQSKEELQKSLEDIQNWKTSDTYKESEHKKLTHLIGNYEFIKSKIESYNARFIEEIFDTMKTSKEEYIIARGNEYIKSLKRGGAYLTEEIEKAWRFNLARATQIASRFSNFSPVKA